MYHDTLLDWSQTYIFKTPLGQFLFAGVTIVIIASVLTYSLSTTVVLHPGLPIANLDRSKSTRLGLEKARQDWTEHGKSILEQGLKKFPSCFQVITESGAKIIIPHRFVDEIRNHPDLSFGKATAEEFFGSYPGFEPFGYDHSSIVVLNTVRGRLTQSLNLITDDLADETSKAIHELFGEPKDWTDVMYKPLFLDLIARVSSRVFIGAELCDNKEWLEISQEYVVDSFIAIRALRQWLPALRPIVHWFLPECRKLRATLAEAKRIISPVVRDRWAANDIAKKDGKAYSKVADTIGWMDDASHGHNYDAAVAQLGLSFAAIHTTTETLSGIISDLCSNPELFQPLRQEIITVLGDKGLTKQALQNLKLMDSVMKESQRHHFGDIGAMHRLAEKPITLSDGVTIPKGAYTMVSIDNMYDPEIFPEPFRFNGYRFFDMREKPGEENRWQFVTTSADHLSFGHGKHSCPGRFFAANEIKIVLIHLLMTYEWKFTPEGRKEDQRFGQETEADPTAIAMIRIRTDVPNSGVSNIRS